MGTGFSKNCGKWCDQNKHARFSKEDIQRKRVSKNKINRIAFKSREEIIQSETNYGLQRREVEIIHQRLQKDIKEFLKSDDGKPSESRPYLHVVANKMLELLSEEKYPEYKQRYKEDGDPIFDKITKEPLEAYQAANYLSIPRYFQTTEGTWNTISQHINSHLTKTSQTSIAEGTYSPENIRDFLNCLGDFILDKVDSKKKEKLFKDVPQGSSVAEHYRHFLDQEATELLERTELPSSSILQR